MFNKKITSLVFFFTVATSFASAWRHRHETTDTSEPITEAMDVQDYDSIAAEDPKEWVQLKENQVPDNLQPLVDGGLAPIGGFRPIVPFYNPYDSIKSAVDNVDTSLDGLRQQLSLRKRLRKLGHSVDKTMRGVRDAAIPALGAAAAAAIIG